MTIKEEILELNRSLPDGVVLVAVSKTHPAESIIEAYEAGQRVFGESRPQELCAKYEQLPKDIEWHMIGHLQTNKVRSIAPFISLIHSVDSLRLLDVINKEAELCGRVINVLLEVHVAQEESKFGWNVNELREFVLSCNQSRYENVRIRGLMAIASNTVDMNIVKNEFVKLHDLFNEFKLLAFGKDFEILSMGMTSDYKLAVECGSNMVRIGSKIFGQR